MAKDRYRYDPDSFKVEKERLTLRDKLRKSAVTIISSLVLATLLLLAAYLFFNSPKERIMQREIDNLKLQYAILNGRMEQAQKILDDLSDRDDNIYRIIFEAEPLHDSTQRGENGVIQYAHLEGFENSPTIISTTWRMDQLFNRLYAQSKSFNEVFEIAKKKEEMLRCIPAIQPIRDIDLKRISSYFGYRPDPYYKVRKFHKGIDFSAPTGKEVVATGDAKVVEVKRSRRGYGNILVLDHGYAYQTVYAHLNEFKVRKGETVKRGQVIATVGNTGKSTAPHLHYEIRKNGKAINPIHFFFNDLSPDQYEEILKLSLRPTQSMD
ncbi:MAG: peptidase M23 [Bacteroidetes bacterium]|nr:MAG: peptidase M23 [Bacteroidota bacterium]